MNYEWTEARRRDRSRIAREIWRQKRAGTFVPRWMRERLIPCQFTLLFVHQWIIVANGFVSGVTATENKAEEIRSAAGPFAIKTLI